MWCFRGVTRLAITRLLVSNGPIGAIGASEARRARGLAIRLSPSRVVSRRKPRLAGPRVYPSKTSGTISSIALNASCRSARARRACALLLAAGGAGAWGGGVVQAACRRRAGGVRAACGGGARPACRSWPTCAVVLPPRIEAAQCTHVGATDRRAPRAQASPTRGSVAAQSSWPTCVVTPRRDLWPPQL